MRHLTATLCLTLAVLLGSAGMGWGADFQKGLDAVQRGDYTTALREWKPLAEHGNLLHIEGGKSADREMRHHYNTVRSHSSLAYRPPAPETVLPNVDVPPYVVDGLRPEHQLNQRQPLT